MGSGGFIFFTFIMLAIIFITTLLIIGILLIVRAYQTNLKNLIYGGLGFLLTAVTQLFEQLYNIPYLVEILLTRSVAILVVLFTNATFHKQKKNLTPKIILIAALVFTIVSAYFYYLRDISPSQELYYTIIIINFLFVGMVYGWLSWSSYSAYIIIKAEDIEPWVKARYQISAFSSFLIIFRPLTLLLKPWNIDWVACTDLNCLISVLFALIITLGFSVALSLTWIMPSWFKEYLNKKYFPSKGKLGAKREPGEIINFLGDYLAEKITLSPSASRGMIKLAIKEQLGAFIEFNKISLKDLNSVIQGSLKRRLIELKEQDKISKGNIDDLIIEMTNKLISGQALITMANA